MATQLSNDHLKQWLNELGQEPADIAKSLAAKNIKGATECAENCPVANYLKTKMREIGVEEGQISANVTDDNIWAVATVHGFDYAIETPEPIQHFIALFDDGNYPDLDSDEDDDDWEDEQEDDDSDY